MQIRDVNAAAIARTYTRQVGGGEGGSGRTNAAGVSSRARTDSVSMSNVRQEVMRVRDVVAAQPDVRPEKVAALKQQISQGSYEIDTRTLAAKMLG
jgi:negative regulator of flagellin synthesis FlgM